MEVKSSFGAVHINGCIDLRVRRKPCNVDVDFLKLARSLYLVARQFPLSSLVGCWRFEVGSYDIEWISNLPMTPARPDFHHSCLPVILPIIVTKIFEPMLKRFLPLLLILFFLPVINRMTENGKPRSPMPIICIEPSKPLPIELFTISFATRGQPHLCIHQCGGLWSGFRSMTRLWFLWWINWMDLLTCPRLNPTKCIASGWPGAGIVKIAARWYSLNPIWMPITTGWWLRLKSWTFQRCLQALHCLWRYHCKICNGLGRQRQLQTITFHSLNTPFRDDPALGNQRHLHTWMPLNRVE